MHLVIKGSQDRMTPLALASAIGIGKTAVVCARSGNAATSLSAYAAAAAVPSKILATASLPDGCRIVRERKGAAPYAERLLNVGPR
ncbi:hypothetical protein PSP20601_05423 [Pandoraea sputorum]|nr:hypothetical protein PSP20601_05423 [Pandoraea sputorum]